MARSRRSPSPGVCTVCTAPTPPADELCRTHGYELVKALRALLPGDEDLIAELATTRHRLDRAAVQEGARAGGDRGLVWNEAASDVEFDLATTLNGWSLEVIGRGVEPKSPAAVEDPRDPLAAVDQHDLVAVVEWLLRNSATLLRLPASGKAHAELIRVINRVRVTVDLPAIATRFPVGPCPETVDGALCGGWVHAMVRSTAKRTPLDDARSWMECDWDSEHRWDETRWTSLGRRVQRVAAEQAAAAPTVALPDPYATCPRCQCAGNHGVALTHFRAPRLKGRDPDEEIVVTMAGDPPDGTLQIERTCAFCGHQWRTTA